tara:strand:+ start:5458 stop:6252 length:795 start_codon:yes stop_codon:yes gene_type:complete
MPMASKKQTQPLSHMALWATSWEVDDRPLRVDLGNLTLVAAKLSHEWQLNYRWHAREEKGGFSVDYISAAAEPEGVINRIAMEAMTGALKLRPCLADRPVVIRPYAPLTIPGHHKITLYVSTPLWLAVEFSDRVKRELPSHQLSDTWMGALTGQGELCYGSHTHARLDRDMLPNRPFRAISPITIHNKSNGDCTLERLSIPAPFLSLFAQDDQLVTEPLSITMDAEKSEGVVRIGKLADATLINRPRKTSDRGILISAWENLFA